MDKSLFQKQSVIVKLILDLLITFLVFTVIFFIGLAIGSKIYHIPVLSFITNAATMDNIAALKYLVFLQSVALFLFPAYAISWLFSRPTSFFGLNRVPSWRTAGMIILVVLISQVVVNYLAFVNNALHFPPRLEQMFRTMESQNLALTRRLLLDASFSALAVNIFIIALIPALGEELFFRGVIQRHLQEGLRNYHVAVITTAFIFAFVHFSFFTFLPRFFLGIILGYIYVWQKNIWASALAHFTNNFLGVVMYFVAVRRGMDLTQLEHPQKASFLLFAAGFILVILLMIKIKQWSDVES